MVNGQSDKVIKLPGDPQEITRRLTAVCNESSVVRKLYPQIASMAGQELNYQGVILTLVLAWSDFSEQYPPPLGAVLWLYVPDWIDALIDDKEVAQAAKDSLAGSEQILREKIAAETPPRVEPEGPVENYNLYSAAHEIADIVFEYISPDYLHEIWMEDRRGEGANPYYNQSSAGLFLGFYYGMPSRLWTPWGEWGFGGGGSGGNHGSLIPLILERLGATEFAPLQHMPYGEVGPVYALTKVDDIELPKPKVREHQNFLEYEVAKKAWGEMTQRYNKEGALELTSEQKQKLVKPGSETQLMGLHKKVLGRTLTIVDPHASAVYIRVFPTTTEGGFPPMGEDIVWANIMWNPWTGKYRCLLYNLPGLAPKTEHYSLKSALRKARRAVAQNSSIPPQGWFQRFQKNVKPLRSVYPTPWKVESYDRYKEQYHEDLLWDNMEKEVDEEYDRWRKEQPRETSRQAEDLYPLI